MWRPIRFSVAITVWLLVPAGPSHARIEDLDVVPEASRVSIQASSGIYFDRSPQDGGTVFIPFAAQSGAGVGGPTNGLRAALEGRLRVDFRPDDPTPTLAIRGFSTLFAPVASGLWLPGVPGGAATPFAAQGAVTIGSVSAFAVGQAALRDLALTIDASHPLVATGTDRWAWPDGPFTGATPDVVEVRVADGAIDFGLSITALTRDFIREGSKRPLVLSAASRIRVIESGDRLELRMPLNMEITKTLVEPVSSLPVRVRLDLDGRLVARNFIPEPGAAAAALAALGVLALLARRRTRTHPVGAGRELVQIAMLALLIGVACPGDPLPGCSNDSQCGGDQKCVNNICTGDGSCNHKKDCADPETCVDGACKPPADPGEPCDGDGDCESDSCTDGTCDGCEGDEDCDGVGAGDDCPNTPPEVDVNEVGCFKTLTQPDGTRVGCNTSVSCSAATPDGLGPCFDAVYYTPDGVVWDGFGANLFTSFGTLLHSTQGGVIRVDSFQLDCGGNASCAQRADGSFTCSGNAGECDAHWPQTDIDCGGVECEQFIDVDAVDEPFANVLYISKESVDANGVDPSDGSFDFELASDGPAPYQASIATSGGAGTKQLEYARHGDDLTVTETVPAGWELEQVICDGAFAQNGSSITVTEFDESGWAHCTFRNRRLDSGDVIPAGGVIANDAISPTSQPFGITGGNLIVVAGSNGLVVMDPLTGTIPSIGNTDLSILGGFIHRTLLGAMVVETPAADDADAFFTYQNTTGGAIQTYVPEILDFGATLALMGTFRDAVHLGDDPSQTSALLTTPGGVQRFVWTDYGTGQLYPNTATALNNFTGAGSAISAFAFPAMTRILAVTSGTPGKLVIGDPAQYFQAVTIVGDVGNDPRNIRCLGTVCAISNFGSDSLTIATWDGATNVAITDTQAVGDGPNGIDLVALDGGNVAIASAGFNDSSYSITVASPSGIVLANSTLAVPAGCEQPGDALWLGDPEQHLVISCFGSDALAVFVPAIPQN